MTTPSLDRPWKISGAASVEVGSWNPIIYDVFYIPNGGCLGFISSEPSTAAVMIFRTSRLVGYVSSFPWKGGVSFNDPINLSKMKWLGKYSSPIEHLGFVRCAFVGAFGCQLVGCRSYNAEHVQSFGSGLQEVNWGGGNVFTPWNFRWSEAVKQKVKYSIQVKRGGVECKAVSHDGSMGRKEYLKPTFRCSFLWDLNV